GAVLPGVVLGVGHELRPHGGEGGEDLKTMERVSAVAVGAGLGDRAEEDTVVAGFGDAEGKDIALHGSLEDLPPRVDPIGDKVAAEPDNDLVHVDAESGRRG